MTDTIQVLSNNLEEIIKKANTLQHLYHEAQQKARLLGLDHLSDILNDLKQQEFSNIDAVNREMYFLKQSCYDRKPNNCKYLSIICNKWFCGLDKRCSYIFRLKNKEPVFNDSVFNSIPHLDLNKCNGCITYVETENFSPTEANNRHKRNYIEDNLSIK